MRAGVKSPANSCRINSNGYRVTNVECGVGNHARQQTRNRDVKDGADDERAEDADGHVPLRILGFLCRGGYSIESDIGEEYYGGPASNSRPAVMSVLTSVWRNKWMPVL